MTEVSSGERVLVFLSLLYLLGCVLPRFVLISLPPSLSDRQSLCHNWHCVIWGGISGSVVYYIQTDYFEANV